MTRSVPDGRQVRGENTRRAVLRRAVDIASAEGLEGLSIGRLSTELQLSKSGVFAHFGSKEELQLAAVRAAGAIFAEHIVTPALEVRPGLARLWALCDGWLNYAEGRIFPGGCFFFSVAAEFDARPGRVHDAVAEAMCRWIELLEQTVADAVQLGELREPVEASQLAFELDALGRTANAHAVLFGDDDLYVRARSGMLARLRAVATDPGVLPG